MNYQRESLLGLLDPPTIAALKNIYNLSLKNIAVRIHCTPQAVHYLLATGNLKMWQKEKILDLFLDNGLDATELILVNSMTNKKVKLSCN